MVNMTSITTQAQLQGIKIKSYKVIYDLFDDVKQMLNDMLDPIIEHKFVAQAKVLQIFNVSKVGRVIGCLITSGIVTKNLQVSVTREGNNILSNVNIVDLKRETYSVT